MSNQLKDFLSGSKELFSDLTNHTTRTLLAVGFALFLLFLISLAVKLPDYLVSSPARANPQVSSLLQIETSDNEPYLSTQMAYQMHPDNEPSYIDLDGRGMLIPNIELTYEAAIKMPQDLGEPTKYYPGRVVVMILDPSTYYSIRPSGKSERSTWKNENVYAFYLHDMKRRENIIPAGGKKYKVILLAIDGPSIDNQYNRSYKFRIEEIINVN